MTADEAAISSWAFEPIPAFALLFSALIYWRGWRRLSQQAPARYPAWRLWCFFAGLAAIYTAMASPLDAFASFLLSAHMVQHMVLTMIVPPLILYGAPQLPMLLGLPRRFVTAGLGPFLHSPVLKGLFHRLTHPAVCWSLFVLSNLLWHIPPVYDLTLRNSTWHEIEHFCFLATALLFWWPVIQPWPARARWPQWAFIPYLLLADLQNTALAGILSFYEGVLYPTYASAPRIINMTALQDQAAAGAIMWVPGSIAFFVPAGIIAAKFLSPKHGVRPSEYRRAQETSSPTPASVRPSPQSRGAFDILKIPYLGALIRSRYFRRALQALMLLLAAAIIIDGLLGPEMSPMNLAGVLPWTHWRAFTVIALLAIGNLFCMACPFTFVRDIGRNFLPAHLAWPRWLRSKWLAVALIILYLWAYEAFDLWDRPSATAWIILGYFLAALLIDGFFRGASFCKYVCPIGQFHFVQSLASPFEIKIRRPDVCASCTTFDCIKGNETQRGCELKLFQPRKSGNMDCTFCLDCVKACPHDNVGLLAVVPGHDLRADLPRSSVGRYAKRTDLAALVLVLTFGAFANAAGMVVPVLTGIADLGKSLGLSSDLLPVTILSLLALVVFPFVSAALAALASHRAAGTPLWENFNRFSIALAPLGFGMWLAHFVFHFFTAALTPLPVFQRIAAEAGFAVQPVWAVASWAFYDLPGLELLLLDLGLLLTLYVLWRIAHGTFRAFLPWGFLALLLYAAGVWIIFQPMEMRGTMLH